MIYAHVNRGGRGVGSPLDGVGVLPVFFTAANPYAFGGLRHKQRV